MSELKNRIDFVYILRISSLIKTSSPEISLDLTRISLPAFPAWAICT